MAMTYEQVCAATDAGDCRYIRWFLDGKYQDGIIQVRNIDEEDESISFYRLSDLPFRGISSFLYFDEIIGIW